MDADGVILVGWQGIGNSRRIQITIGFPPDCMLFGIVVENSPRMMCTHSQVVETSIAGKGTVR